MARKISVSFKETCKDIELYNLLMSMDDKSYEIKQILREVLLKDKKQQQYSNIEKEEKSIDILNF